MILTTDDHVIRVLASQVEDPVLLRRRQAERDDFVALLLAFGDEDEIERRTLTSPSGGIALAGPAGSAPPHLSA